MKRRLLIFTILFATTFLVVPFESYGSTDRSGSTNTVTEYSGQDWRWQRQRRGRRGKHKGWKNTYGYRNYGQYRRTQVGNRRYRMVRRYYWNDGVRLSRLVRLYY
jgi:hypothetical protein